MLTETITLHTSTGAIAWLWASNAIDPDFDRYIGKFPWEWVIERDRIIVKQALGLALLGQQQGPIRYQLDPAIYAGLWTVESRWIRLPSVDMPILGISRTFNSVVENLSPRERDIARLIPDFSTKQIAKKLGISASTVETFRRRLAMKLGIDSSRLASWCQSHRDII